MAKKDMDELAGGLDVVEDAAPVGSGWEHMRSGGLYTVAGHALREDDLEPCVLYHEITDDRVWWIRPAIDFLDGRFVRRSEVDC